MGPGNQTSFWPDGPSFIVHVYIPQKLISLYHLKKIKTVFKVWKKHTVEPRRNANSGDHSKLAL